MHRRCRPATLSSALAALASTLALAIAGCASTPPVHLHTLMPPDPPARVVPAAVLPPVLVDAIRIPAQVDQPQWLVRLGDGSLAALEQERWAAPLRDELHQAVVEQLVRRHGVIDVRSGAAAPTSYVRVSIDIRRFESIPGREARIEGVWTLTPNRAGLPALRCDWLIGESVEAGMPALAAGHRRALARLVDGIAANLARVEARQPAECGPFQNPA